MHQKYDIFLDKDTRKLYIFDGNEWWEIIPDCYLKKMIGFDYEQ